MLAPDPIRLESYVNGSDPAVPWFDGEVTECDVLAQGVKALGALRDLTREQVRFELEAGTMRSRDAIGWTVFTEGLLVLGQAVQQANCPPPQPRYFATAVFPGQRPPARLVATPVWPSS